MQTFEHEMVGRIGVVFLHPAHVHHPGRRKALALPGLGQEAAIVAELPAAAGDCMSGETGPHGHRHPRAESCAGICIWRTVAGAASDATGARDALFPLSQANRYGTAANRFQGSAWWSEGGSNP